MAGTWTERVRACWGGLVTHFSVEESQTKISSWWRRWGGGRAGGRGEMSSLVPAARLTAIISYAHVYVHVYVHR